MGSEVEFIYEWENRIKVEFNYKKNIICKINLLRDVKLHEKNKAETPNYLRLSKEDTKGRSDMKGQHEP